MTEGLGNWDQGAGIRSRGGRGKAVVECGLAFEVYVELPAKRFRSARSEWQIALHVIRGRTRRIKKKGTEQRLFGAFKRLLVQ